jgi:hypothetical protein
MTSTIKVDNIQNQCGANIINESANTITIGASGDTVSLASGASQSGFGRSGSVDWQTGSIKTATFTAADGEGYFCDTSSSSFTVNLPAGSAGAIVAVSDYTRTFQTNSLTVSPNGSEKIGGVAADAILDTEGQTATFVYVDSTEGWINVQETSNSVTGNPNIVATGGTITTCGNCKIHTFTGPGTFTVSNISTTPANNTVSYLVVAGGGGGEGGGGGAGGFREYKSPVTPYTASPLDGNPGGTSITLTATSYPITVGAGGAGGSGSTGGDGNNSVFSTVTSTGGGGGAAQGSSGSSQCGGSGGGSGQDSTASGGSGNTPPVSPSQGNNGGSGGPGPYGGAGAGGGATAVGSNAGAKVPSIPGSPGSPGGAGAGTLIAPASGEAGPGPSRYYSGGGAGGSNVDANPTPGSITQGLGGIGGGGDGGRGANDDGVAGTANTGGGGGGGEWQAVGGAGGSGIVVIRYKFQ